MKILQLSIAMLTLIGFMWFSEYSLNYLTNQPHGHDDQSVDAMKKSERIKVTDFITMQLQGSDGSKDYLTEIAVDRN